MGIWGNNMGYYTPEVIMTSDFYSALMFMARTKCVMWKSFENFKVSWN